MKKTIIALIGPGGQGKSSTIKLFFELLKANYPNLKIKMINEDGDITVIVEINAIKIGIESQGDPQSRLGKSLKLFVKEECSFIVELNTLSAKHLLELLETVMNQ